ncbi:hypothetical protein F2P79_007494 [Pimephales promelas]|nr:hypothetical protein F2P79_007494 [Pimephales promelas]
MNDDYRDNVTDTEPSQDYHMTYSNIVRPKSGSRLRSKSVGSLVRIQRDLDENADLSPTQKKTLEMMSPGDQEQTQPESVLSRT